MGSAGRIQGLPASVLSGILPAHPKVPIHASARQDDLSFAGYQKHLSSCAAPAPLTSAERELQQIRINEVDARDWLGRSPGLRPSRSHGAQLAGLCSRRATPWSGRSGPPSLFPRPQVKTEISVESKHQTLQGLTFPLQPAAQRALQQLRQKTVNYIQLVGVHPAQIHGAVALVLLEPMYGAEGGCPAPPLCGLVVLTVPCPLSVPTRSSSECNPRDGVPLPCSVLAYLRGHL